MILWRALGGKPERRREPTLAERCETLRKQIAECWNVRTRRQLERDLAKLARRVGRGNLVSYVECLTAHARRSAAIEQARAALARAGSKP